MPEYKSANN